jgi:hypothetical protein
LLSGLNATFIFESASAAEQSGRGRRGGCCWAIVIARQSDTSFFAFGFCKMTARVEVQRNYGIVSQQAFASIVLI